MLSGQNEVALVSDGPEHLLALGEVHGLSDGGWEVDVPLFGLLALDELYFSWIAHRRALSSYKTRSINKKMNPSHKSSSRKPNSRSGRIPGE